MPKPDIPFIQGDQLATQFLRCCGDPVRVAPGIEAPAARGTVFGTTHCDPIAEDG